MGKLVAWLADEGLVEMKERESLVLMNSFTFLFVDFAALQVLIPPHTFALREGLISTLLMKLSQQVTEWPQCKQ